MLNSALKHGAQTVKRVVITASCASILEYGPTPRVFTEKDWNERAIREVNEKGKAAANKQFVAQSVEMSKAAKRRLEEERRVDATVFEYDEVWDKMQQAKLKQKEAKEAESKERKVSTLPPSCIVPVSCER